jgi:hypothetical protein
MLMQDQRTNEQLVVWHRFQDKILIKIKSYSAVADDSLPISISVKTTIMSLLCMRLISQL